MKALTCSLIVIFNVLANTCYAQSLCINIDSLVIHHLPLTLRTTLALSEFDVINPSDYGHKVTVVDDSTSLSHFFLIELLGEPFNTNQSELSIDARIVIELYSGKSKILSIVMNRRGWYSIGYEIYRSQKLMSWLNSNIEGISLPSP
ncbi:MAG: hypothetical protein EA358_00145 [Flavobacteriales bacterium]|nr:MAG: hypothetical protein EA358_00145 [Flavobacteriales bacterium]